MYAFIKRLFDLIVALIFMPIIIVVTLAVWVAVKIEDGGPVFYMAARTGRYGKPFKMFKYRSMKVNAPDIRLADGSTFNSDDDPRVTKVGKFLRKTSIDEIPQLINVLIGDMALIGPRPDTPMYLDKYTKEERVILNVRPGITGYNQAINRNTVLTKEKLKNDIYYVQNMSLWFDIKILWMTVCSVLGHKNINRVDVGNNETYILESNNSKTLEETETK